MRNEGVRVLMRVEVMIRYTLIHEGSSLSGDS